MSQVKQSSGRDPQDDVGRDGPPSSSRGGASSRPKTVVCYLCGREFGTQSIAIHEPQCLKKWKQDNDQLPKNLRRPEPIKPQAFVEAPIGGSGKGTYNLDAANDSAFQAAMENRVTCKGCGRRFNPDRIQVHQRACR